MQHRAAFEMAAAADQRDAVPQFEGVAFPQIDRRIRPHDPLPVGGMQMDVRAEGVRPFHHRGVEMRMRDGDRLDAAERLDRRHGRGIERCDAIPQHVAAGGAQQQRALADGKARADADDARLRIRARRSCGFATALRAWSSSARAPARIAAPPRRSRIAPAAASLSAYCMPQAVQMKWGTRIPVFGLCEIIKSQGFAAPIL